jgi:hypothetical protein
MYTPDPCDLDFGANATYLAGKIRTSTYIGCKPQDYTYRICNLSLLEVYVQITIGHPRNLVNFTKGLGNTDKLV